MAMLVVPFIVVIIYASNSAVTAASLDCKAHDNTYIAMNNDREIMKELTVAACKATCESEVGFKCVTYEFNKKIKRCYLSKMSYEVAKAKGLIRSSNEFSLFSCKPKAVKPPPTPAPKPIIVLTGKKTLPKDNARTSIACPAGYVPIRCRCANARCDGAFYGAGHACFAQNSFYLAARKRKSRPQVTCLRKSATAKGYKIIKSRRSSNPNVKCPAGYSVQSCSFFTRYNNRGRNMHGEGKLIRKQNSCRPKKSCKAHFKSACIIQVVCRRGGLHHFG